MFETHQSRISKYARANADNFARVMQFVILSAHAQLRNLPADMETVDRGGPEALSVLFAWKHGANVDAWRNRQRHYSYCEHVAESDHSDQAKTEAMLDYLAALPGFGLIKAGFVTQLAYGLGGCLDTHNLKLYKLGPNAFRATKFKALKTRKARQRQLSRYVATVYSAGGPQALWDKWCHHVAQDQPTYYRDAYHVSSIHCEALGLPA